MGKQKQLQEDLAFATDKRDMVLLEAPRGARAMIYTVVLFFGTLLGWSFFAEIDEVRKGEGIAIPRQQIQQIQNLEGGILKVMHVREGDRVKQGDLLLELDTTQFNSEDTEREVEYATLQARAERLLAEVNGAPLRFDEELKSRHPRVVADERSLFESQQNKLNSDLSVLQSRQKQKDKERNELKNKLGNVAKQVKLTVKEYKMMAGLKGSGAVSEVEILQSREKVVEIEKEQDSITDQLTRVDEEYNEITTTLMQTRGEFRSKAKQEENEVRLKISQLAAERSDLKDKLQRASVTAPLDGIVKTISVNTIGGVVQPGMTMLEIVPTDDRIVIETKVNPKDIGFILPGLPARVKFSAYDFATYGGLDGDVMQISADAITDEKGNAYYVVKVETKEKALKGKHGEHLPILPGMRAEVDIMVAKKTIFAYFFNPVLKATDW